MSEWIKLGKRARRGLIDKCSITSTTIAIGRDYVGRLKGMQSADIYLDNKESRIGIIPREDDEGYALRVRGPGVAYVGTKNLITRMNVAQGRYNAKWTTTKLDGEETDILIINVKLKSSEKTK